MPFSCSCADAPNAPVLITPKPLAPLLFADRPLLARACARSPTQVCPFAALEEPDRFLAWGARYTNELVPWLPTPERWDDIEAILRACVRQEHRTFAQERHRAATANARSHISLRPSARLLSWTPDSHTDG